MDLGALRALVLDLNLETHGFPVTVTRPVPDNEPIETRGIWMTPDTSGYPVGSDFSRQVPLRVMAVGRTDVPTMPRGTLIVAPERYGEDERTWMVDGLERQEADHHRVIVIEVEAT